ncbi:hypothetical protein L1F30_13910 [Simiduia sp. 21SJ11W-1]|uniref:hypothetical protein n=1 Tax=Simiduia sp. 21SJ11W-1 TaxID=2909669 RepID=UPI0020A0D9C8|nr:hypothetical protein [Simiduia sp. 21SJ11W-1]UTA47252.1 hypothetical protein L1F30_13910 [Simiduia sp. 21SJ11W-1]
MNERKEPTLGAPHSDEPPARKPTPRPAQPSGAARAPDPRPTRPQPSSRPVAPKASQTLATIALLVAFAGVAGSGYLAWQLQQTQVQSAEMRGQLESRIAELEGQLSMTEGEVMESAEAFKAKLVWADSEIRKLWGVAYDTNRKAIAANTDAISDLEKKLASGNAKLLADVKKQLSGVDSKLLATQATVDDQLDRLHRQIEKLSGMEQQLNKLRNDLSGRLKTNEEAIKAIDIYRLTVNRDLVTLKEQVNALQAR